MNNGTSAQPGVSSTQHSSCPSSQIRSDTPTQHSLSQLIDGFLLTCKLEGKATETCEGYERILGRFCDCVIDKEWTNPTEIRAFFGYIKDTYGLSQATIQKYEVALKSFFHWLIDEGFVEHNPMTKVKIAKAPKTVVKALSPQQLQLLLGSLKDRKIEDARNKAIILIFLDCGLRVSELANLKLEDVDLQRGILRVMGKGSKERLVRMGLKTQKALWRYTLLRGHDIRPCLWLNQRRARLTKTGIEQMLHDLGLRLGLKLHPHLLRHTFAINFLRNRANTFEVQYALGHSSLEMTRRYCQTLSYEDVFKKHQTASPVDCLAKEKQV